MADKIKVIIFALSEFFNYVQKFYDEKNMTILPAYANASETKRLVNNYPDAVVVIDTVSLPGQSVSEIVSFMKSKEGGYIAVVTDVRSGFEYLNMGATDMIVWSVASNIKDYTVFVHNLCMKIKNARRTQQEHSNRVLKYSGSSFSNKILAFGSSTGGTETVQKILQKLPENSPPIVIVQHMPPVFTKLYAERLNRICAMSVWEAQDGDDLRPGLVLIAPGDKHMRLVRGHNGFSVEVKTGEKVNGHCPSVDVLFYSVAETAGAKAVGVILTGMGSDGAKGLLCMRQRGACTIGQDKESSIVYGMPKIAYEIGGVCHQVGLSSMTKTIMENL